MVLQTAGMTETIGVQTGKSVSSGLLSPCTRWHTRVMVRGETERAELGRETGVALNPLRPPTPTPSPGRTGSTAPAEP